MSTYTSAIERVRELKAKYGNWEHISETDAARMMVQNRFKTGLDIAKYTAKIMRQDMAEYDQDTSKYTQSLGAWHGFIAQQTMYANKKHFGTTSKKYIYLSGWMVAALRSEFGPLPDQSMHEKTAVSDLIEEIYTFLRQADAKVLNDYFRELNAAEEAGQDTKAIQDKIENFESHVVPIIADIDAGFGNEEATYLFAKKLIEAGACALQIENQVSDAKQCGHQAGKVTVPHEDYISKLNAIRYAFLELGVEDGVIVARTDSEGASLTQKIPVSNEPGDLASKYIDFIEMEEVTLETANENDSLLKHDGKLVRPKRLPNGLYQFREETNIDRVVLDCVTALENGADLLWIETPTPNVEHIKMMVDRIKEQQPQAKLVYNNSPSFNWTLNFRKQVIAAWEAEGKDISAYNKDNLMSGDYDDTELNTAADELAKNFQRDAAREAGVFHHLITLPTYHTAALEMNELSKGYFGEDGMLAYVAGVQRKEIRAGVEAVKHQAMAGSDIGDDHKEIFSGENALKAGGGKNTMDQFK
ncbi:MULTISPECIES: isocitrate lyase [Psychrobacter]|uniref:Isocitrate lyase n=1 Tax=Psychrobacter urativorans TaxID=45610 RepID=A0A0M5ML92_9GAMM|nr:MULTISPECIES: isocitrate lyase [Psychrobacter]ALF60275.1 isocitrate lyase [Psychrobacter urativorans]